MPKFLSDLEVQGKINSASATIDDLMVGKLEVNGNIFDSWGDGVEIKKNGRPSVVIGDNDSLYVCDTACVFGGLHVGDLGPAKSGYFVSRLPASFCGCVELHNGTEFQGVAAFCSDANFYGCTTFESSPDFKFGFCMNNTTVLGNELKTGITIFDDTCACVGSVSFLEASDATLRVRGMACFDDGFNSRGGYFNDDVSIHCSLIVDGCLTVGRTLTASKSFIRDFDTCRFCVTEKVNILNLCRKTALGADAYAIHASLDGGLQLWGTHFLRGSVVSDNTLKVVHNDISLASTDEAFLGFDYANRVEFWTFPNDGTEATYCFAALQWGDHSHTWKKEAGVRLTKGCQVSPVLENDVLNAGEGDKRWVGFKTDLGEACSTIDFVTKACISNPANSYGVSFGCVPQCPIWVKGGACVQGLLSLQPQVGKLDDGATVGVSYDQFRIDYEEHFCVSAKSFSFTPTCGTGNLATFWLTNAGANFDTCTTFNKDIYTNEKVYLTKLPTYRGSAEPESTSLVTKSYVDNKLSSVYAFKGTKAKKTDLNSITTKAVGDVYNVTEDGMNYAWDGSAWDALGGDLSKYYTKTEVDTKLGGYAKLNGTNRFSGIQYFNGNIEVGRVNFCTTNSGNHFTFTNGSSEIEFKQSSSGTSLCILDGQCLSDSHSYVSLSHNQVVVGYAEPQGGSNLCTEVNQTFVKTGSLALSSFYSTASGNIGNGRVITIDVADPMFSIGSFVQPLIHLKLGNVNKNVAIPWREPAEYSLVADTDLVDYATNEDVYDRSTIDGVDTGAEVLPKMNELIGYLNDYEEKTGEKLPIELYEETVKAIEEWQKDPTVEKDWYNMTDSNTWESSSNCPYTDTVATSPIVDLSVKSTGANIASYPCFNAATNVAIFLPKATSTKVSVGSAKSVFNKPFIAPNSVYWNYFAAWSSNYNMPTFMPKASDASEAFTSTGMSAENISKTLDSLPPYTSGKHVIKFTGSPGASELTQSSPSVAAAVAKGWTVEL